MAHLLSQIKLFAYFHHMKRVLLIINSKARNGAAQATEAKEELTKRGFSVNAPDTSNGDYTEIISKHKDDADIIVAGGGDGTIRLCLEGALRAKKPFGILPLGTANNLARNIGIPLTLKEAVDVIEKGTLVPIDVAYVNDVPFFNVAGLGLSVKINKELPGKLKKRFGIFAYVILAFRFLNHMRPFSAEITVDNETHKVRTMQITVCNGRHYGAGLVIADQATINDSRLDLLSTEVKGWSQAIRAIPALISGKNHDKPGLRKLTAKKITIKTKRRMDLDTDGDITASTPAVFRIEPEKIRIFANSHLDLNPG